MTWRSASPVQGDALHGGRLNAEIDYARAIPLFMSEIEQMGGAERSMLALGRWLSSHGRPVYLLTYRDAAGMSAHADFDLPTVEMRPSGSLVSKLAALRRHFTRLPAAGLPPIVSGYQPALHFSVVLPDRFHCLMHDTAALFSEPRHRSMQQRLRIRISDRIIGRGLRRGGGRMIVTSQFLQAECQADYGVQAVIARMGGLGTPAQFRRRPLMGKLRMLSACRIEANKRIDWMLHALAELEAADTPLSARIDWTLTLAGKGSALESMRQLTQNLGLNDRVHFLGYVPDAELEDLYNTAHLFLMPAVQGYGIPAVEALQRGVPVLLHRDSGVSDILLETPWATVLEGGPESMRPHLEQMIDWLLSSEQMRAAQPTGLPTEKSWAERVANLCSYL